MQLGTEAIWKTGRILASVAITLGVLPFPGMPGSVAAATTEPPRPVENFYAWANRDWLAKTVIPADRPREDNFSQLQDVVYAQLRELLASLKAAPVRTPEQEKLWRLYESFINMERRNAAGLTPLAGEFKRIDAARTHRDLARLFGYFQSAGVLTPVLIASDSDFRDAGHNIAFIAQGGLGLERDYYLGTDEIARKQQKLYREYLLRLFKLAALPDPESTVGRVLDLETRLAGIQWGRIENRDMQKIYNPVTIKEFVAKTSDFYGDDMMTAWGAPRDARLNLMQPTYLEKFGPFFRATPVAVWQDYLRSRLLTAYASLLTSDFKAAKLQYSRDLGLVQEEQEMWRQGVDFVAATVDMMLGRAYVEKYYDKASKDSVTAIVNSIRESFRASMAQAAWMSGETRKKALEKLDKMQFKIGYPDKWRDYSPLDIPGTDLAENYRRAMGFDHRRNMAKIGHPIDRNEWGHAPHEINAYYDPTRNEFVLLAAILQEPFYSATGSMAMKYGGLGFVVGHEIGHGFDDQGCRFDGDGNLRNWWTEADAKAYNIKRDRLIAQANAYEILPGTFLKGEQEIGEIMGDLSGAQIALRAYRSTPDASDSAFFTQLAQTWRSKWRDEFIRMVIQADNHPPSEFRSNGIVKQFEEFHRAFNVQPGDKMYLAPESRVLLW